MALAFTHLSWWLWSGKSRKPKITNEPSMNSSVDSGVRESDALKFPWVKQAKMGSSSRKAKRKWCSREKQKIDKEYDVVLVPSDGGCVSDSESDGSDWSIGWLEPHGPEFLSDGESDKSFAVLVPCYEHQYGGTVEDPKSNILSIVGNFPDSYSDESKKYVENWLSSLQNS